MGEGLDELLDQLYAVRQETMNLLTKTSDADLDNKTERGLTLRRVLQMLTDHDDEHLQHILRARRAVGARRGEIHRLMGEMQAARGELIGNVMGLTPEQLDKEWEEGEWAIRQILIHMVDTERSYMEMAKGLLGTVGT